MAWSPVLLWISRPHLSYASVIISSTLGLNATVPDGNCQACIYGCNDENALNYNPDANGSEAGACEYQSSVTCDSANYIALNSTANGYHGSQVWSTFTLESAHVVFASASSGNVTLVSACDGDTLEFGVLDAGTYFLSVVNSSSADGNSYSLTLDATEIPECSATQAFLTVDASNWATEIVWQFAEDGITIASQDEPYSGNLVDIRPLCLEHGKVYTMNAYDTNGDGINDQWEDDAFLRYTDNKVWIYTRSGQLVFEKSNYQNN